MGSIIMDQNQSLLFPSASLDSLTQVSTKENITFPRFKLGEGVRVVVGRIGFLVSVLCIIIESLFSPIYSHRTFTPSLRRLIGKTNICMSGVSGSAQSSLRSNVQPLS